MRSLTPIAHTHSRQARAIVDSALSRLLPALAVGRSFLKSMLPKQARPHLVLNPDLLSLQAHQTTSTTNKYYAEHPGRTIARTHWHVCVLATDGQLTAITGP